MATMRYRPANRAPGRKRLSPEEECEMGVGERPLGLGDHDAEVAAVRVAKVSPSTATPHWEQKRLESVTSIPHAEHLAMISFEQVFYDRMRTPAVRERGKTACYPDWNRLRTKWNYRIFYSTAG